MEIRDADSTHLETITEIHNDAVRHTTAVWDDHPVDLADRAAWLTQRRQAGFPVLVAVDEHGSVLGYASYGTWRARDGFRHTVENSVYVRDGQQGNGVGRSLMLELIDRAQQQGVHVMVAGIEAGNAGSIRLHEKLGFVEVARMPEVGVKFGRWLDLVFLQLTIQGDATPGHDAAEG
ncbi:GNAT family N-acetyltransferase [Brachybacterium sp. GCM10030267]|uniref:GNAT family N-acetyltransferase n=1 Tax=Brachybacterium sp. GCM10030267 TaxID=3273381 RepID=UPI003621192D